MSRERDGVEALAAYEDWADEWVQQHLARVARYVTRRDPHKLAKARRQRMERQQSEILPAFREPVPTVEALTAWYEARDTAETVRGFVDAIFQRSFLSGWRWQEWARSQLTQRQFEALKAHRERIYPSDPSYTCDFWRNVGYALVWCSEPILEPTLALHDWLGDGGMQVRDVMDAGEEELAMRQMILAEVVA